MAIKDFKASSIKLQDIISKDRETSQTLPSISIVSSESLISNTKEQIHANLGEDVFIFISGSIDSVSETFTNGNPVRGTAVFGGDVVISGTLYVENGIDGINNNPGPIDVSGLGVAIEKKLMSLYELETESLVPRGILQNTDDCAFFIEIDNRENQLFFNLVPTEENNFDDKHFVIDGQNNITLRENPVNSITNSLPIISIVP